MKNSGLAFIKIIIGVLVLFAVIVVGYQLYKYNFVSIRTESAVMGEMEEVVKSKGLFFRDEKVVENGGYDYLDVIRAEGERVAAGGVIARVYRDEQSAKDQKVIRELKEKIATYEEVLSNSGSYQSAASSIDEAIYSNIVGIASLAQEGGMDAFNKADSLVVEIMKKKIASGDLVHYDSVLNDLRGQLKALNTTSSDSVNAIKSPESGYFSFGTDGLEDRYTLDVLKELSVETFDETAKWMDDAASDHAHLGKLVYDNNWSVAIKVDTDDVSKLEAGNTVYIRIPSFGNDRIKCTVTELRKSGKETLLILSSSIISENILTLRQEEISLIVKTYNGIQVRQSALRKVDGEDGVFVKVGLLLKYKNVNILYNDGTNAIIEYDAAATGGLRLYDQVVYKGSNLYSGKAVSDG